MFIEPIQVLTSIDTTKVSSVTKEPSGGMIKSVFQDTLQNVIETDTAVAGDMQALVTGETDNLHTLAIDQTKAQLSIELLVQLRNRFMESYNEIMRINL